MKKSLEPYSPTKKNTGYAKELGGAREIDCKSSQRMLRDNYMQLACNFTADPGNQEIVTIVIR